MNKRVVLLANDTTYTYNLRLALIKELIKRLIIKLNCIKILLRIIDIMLTSVFLKFYN